MHRGGEWPDQFPHRTDFFRLRRLDDHEPAVLVPRRRGRVPLVPAAEPGRAEDTREEDTREEGIGAALSQQGTVGDDDDDVLSGAAVQRDQPDDLAFV